MYGFPRQHDWGGNSVIPFPGMDQGGNYGNSKFMILKAFKFCEVNEFVCVCVGGYYQKSSDAVHCWELWGIWHLIWRCLYGCSFQLSDRELWLFQLDWLPRMDFSDYYFFCIAVISTLIFKLHSETCFNSWVNQNLEQGKIFYFKNIQLSNTLHFNNIYSKGSYKKQLYDTLV